MTAAATVSTCHTLVGGFGVPGQRDLDFGDKFVRCAQMLEWPDGVVVEDLSCAAHLVLHRLQELRPEKVIFVGAVSRGLDPPGTIRRYRLSPGAGAWQDVHAHVSLAVAGDIALDHTLAVVRHWGALPDDAVVVEVEAADVSFGPGFSEPLAAAIDELVDIVRREVDARHPSAGRTATPGHDTGIAQLFSYAEAHRRLRDMERLGQGLPSHDRLGIAARFLPAGRALQTSGTWYDVIPSPDGVGVAVGDVVGRGVDAMSEVAQLRAATRAVALLDGYGPARLIGLLDRLVASLHVGESSTLLYVTIDAATGRAVLSNAGHCPALLITPGAGAGFLSGGLSPPLGLFGGGEKPEVVTEMAPGSTLLLTTGLVEHGDLDLRHGLQTLLSAAVAGPTDLEQLCDHVLDACLPQWREDDVSLVAVRLLC